jgi:large-conductance mechanosensitive channel
MPDLSQLMGLVRWEVVAGMAALPIVLQFVAAIIHPAVFNLVTLLVLGGLAWVAYTDWPLTAAAKSPEELTTLHAQFLEMAIVGLIVLVSFILIRWMFKSMARATRLA